MAIVLSGGGAKGSFEVGALRYLYYKANVRPDIVCGTSVGALNAIKITEGESPDEDSSQGLKGLIKIWDSLNGNEDMYVMQPWLNGIEEHLRNAIIGRAGGDSTYTPLQIGLAANLPGWVIGAFGYPSLADIMQLINRLHENKSIFNLSPLRARMEHGGFLYPDKPDIDLKKVESSAITMMLAVVSLESGRLRYVTNSGEMLQANFYGSWVIESLNQPPVNLIDAVIASAADPVFLEGTVMNGETYLDGGLRAVDPLAAALGCGANLVYVISWQPDMTYKPDPGWHWSILEIIPRTLDILVDGIHIDNVYPYEQWTQPVFVIKPNLMVHDSFTIDPPLIRINEDYGYMSAFDKLDPRSKAFDEESLAWITNHITSNRMQTLSAERFHDGNDPELAATDQSPFFDQAEIEASIAGSSLVNEIRSLKNELVGMIRARVTALGPDSLPAGFDEGWGNVWESTGSNASPPYSDASYVFLEGNTPWGDITIQYFDDGLTYVPPDPGVAGYGVKGTYEPGWVDAHIPAASPNPISPGVIRPSKH